MVPARIIAATAIVWLGCTPGPTLAQESVYSARVVDFRYAPPDWQTCIGLSDDWQKTLVGKNGSLRYDYPGPHGGFSTRITFGMAGGASEWTGQELASARVPIVRTVTRRGAVECVAEAFAVSAPDDGVRREARLERLDGGAVMGGWAAPKGGADPAFADIAVGWNAPIAYRFKATPDARYTVVFGLCEGYHPGGGHRRLDLKIEGKSRRTVDPAGERGQNVAGAYAAEATDENGDGWIDIAVASAPGSPDTNTILNVLWVFPSAGCPTAEQIVTGAHNDAALVYQPCGEGLSGPGRDDIVLVRLRGTGAAEATGTPTLTIESTQSVRTDDDCTRVRIGGQTTVVCPAPFVRADREGTRTTLVFADVKIPAGGERDFAFGVHRGRGEGRSPVSVEEARALRGKSAAYWKGLDLPYGRIQVPDAGVQALLDSSIRNIYQAREIKKGLPAFQVGPTVYRGLWVVDGSFLLEAAAYLGRVDEARRGIEYLLGFQRDDGGFMLMNRHWKETGIVVWAVTRHARLTGDKEWLASVWPRLERGLTYIRGLRREASKDPAAANAGLIPAGFSDGGLGESAPEYTNVYWTLVGLRAGAEAAKWLGKADRGADWQHEYDDFLATYRRAALRDQRSDPSGNRYVPIFMQKNEKILPQRAQWAFLHAVYPGQVFGGEDPIVKGNMAMLKAAESEGLVLTTGWLEDGIWNYFGSFYAHAWLWLGEREKAISTMYAFANHASPLLAWREEHRVKGHGPEHVGDMPHNWASAEFVRLVRHFLVLERGDELHLMEGLPAEWVKPGAVTSLTDMPTEFGPLSLTLRVADDGRTAALKVTAPPRTPARRIVLHLDGWSGQAGVQELPTTGVVERVISLGGGRD